VNSLKLLHSIRAFFSSGGWSKFQNISETGFENFIQEIHPISSCIEQLILC